MSEDSGIKVPTAGACAFCDYLARRRPFTILWQSDLAAILVTREQRGSTHLLALPVSHRPTILDLQRAEASALMDAVVLSARVLDAADRRPGIAIWQNNGTDVDQTIPHTHFHVASSLEDGGTERGEVVELSVADTDAIADRLRPRLADFVTPHAT